MKELQHFKDPGNPHITVAIAGISKMDWIAATQGIDVSVASAIMSENRFDILPIMNGSEVTHCFKTIKWGNYQESNIEKYEIRDHDRLYYLTNIEDAIHAFARTKAKFFFLDNLTEIIGLTSLGNLNCKHVYLYLYNLIIQLENLLGKYIHWNGIKDQDLIRLFELRTASDNAANSVKRYLDDDAEAMDYRFIEYIYLADLSYICRHYKLTIELGYSSGKFKDIIGKINNVRNVVAHPNQSLIKKESSIFQLSETIKLTYHLLDLINEKVKS